MTLMYIICVANNINLPVQRSGGSNHNQIMTL